MYIVPLIVLFTLLFSVISGIYQTSFNVKPLVSKSYAYTCCDTGDGKACQPRTDVKKTKFNGDEYGLLKSNIYLARTDHHINPTGEKTSTGEPIFINIANKSADHDHEPDCKISNKDQYDWLLGRPDPNNPDKEHDGRQCFVIPKELLIYGCRTDNPPGMCHDSGSHLERAAFDLWIRLKDIRPNGSLGRIPDIIAKDCEKPNVKEPDKKQTLVLPTYPTPGKKDLQLETFWLAEPDVRQKSNSPFCKPAIYLYPPKKTDVHVAIAPQGKLTLTIPKYPATGWDVTAYPNGNIVDNTNRTFDYLYYEAQIPDTLLSKPEFGYSVSYNEVKLKLETLLPQLGLNAKESQEFVDYWTKALPQSPYYFIGIIPQSTLTQIAPLSISPTPDNLIRVTLYFQALDHNEPTVQPILPLVTRGGFTAVEWGGIFKRDATHTFSCFM